MPSGGSSKQQLVNKYLHPAKQSNSMTGEDINTWYARYCSGKVLLFVCLGLMIAGQVTQNISAPLWHDRLPKDTCRDAFVMYLIMISWYPVMFFVTNICINIISKKGNIFGFLTKYSRSEHWQIFNTGLCDALNGALVIPASPTSRTPAVVAALIGSTTLLPMIRIKHFYFGVKTTKPYNTINFFLVICLYTVSAYTIVYPAAMQPEENKHQLYWWLIFFIGSVFGQFYNVQQELTFKQWELHTFTEFVEYLFWQTFYLFLWGFALIWMDVLPNFGDAHENDLKCSLHDTFQHSFEQPAFTYNALFNLGYYVTYITACVVNKSDALLGTVASVMVTALVTTVSYPSGELTPDKDVVAIGLIPLTLMSSAVSLYMFLRWVETTGVYDVAPRSRASIQQQQTEYSSLING